MRAVISAQEEIAIELHQEQIAIAQEKHEEYLVWEAEQDEKWIEIQNRMDAEEEKMIAIVEEEDEKWFQENPPAPMGDDHDALVDWANVFMVRHGDSVLDHQTWQDDAEDIHDARYGKAHPRAEQYQRMLVRNVLNLMPREES